MSIRNDQPQFEIVEPRYCDICGHYHYDFDSHLELNKLCAAGKCCNKNADDSDD